MHAKESSGSAFFGYILFSLANFSPTLYNKKEYAYTTYAKKQRRTYPMNNQEILAVVGGKEITTAELEAFLKNVSPEQKMYAGLCKAG